MDDLYLKAYGKINLSLDVLYRRPDGYHEVKMIMQTVELHDEIFLEQIDEGIVIECNSSNIPCDERNIAFKAAKLIIDRFSVKKGVKIKIEKNIPVAAGMAGGSTDAAAVIKGLNQLYELGLSAPEMKIIGKEIGADVPYCIVGGTMLSEGIGEKLRVAGDFSGVDLVLVKPAIGVSTAWVYNNLNVQELKVRPDTEFLLDAIIKRDKVSLAHNMKNVLESVTEKKYKEISEIKRKLLDLGALGSMMSGSGPTVFGIFEDKEKAKRAFDNIKNSEYECHLTRTI